MLHMEIVAVSTHIHEKIHKYTLLVETRIYNVKRGGTCSNHKALEG